MFVSISFYSVSKVLLKKIRIASPAEDYIFHTAAGFGLIFYVILIFGFAGCLSKNFFISLVSIQILFCLINVSNTALLFEYLIGKILRIGIGSKIVLALIIINLILHLPGSLAPVAGLDGLTYHLPLSKIYFETGKISIINFLFYSFFPQFAEIFFMYGIYFDNAVFSQLFHWYFYFLTLLMICKTSKIFIENDFFALLPALFFSAAPAINRLTGYTKNEFFMIFYFIASLYFFYKYVLENNNKWMAISLVFCAVSNNIKYHGIINSIIIIFLFALYFIISRRYSQIFKFIIFFGVFIILSSPFYIRNYIYIGNPAYPFLTEIFKIKQAGDKNVSSGEHFQTNTKNMVRHFKETKLNHNPAINFLKFPYQVSIKFQTYDFWKYSISPMFFIFYCCLWIMIFFLKKNEAHKILYAALYSVIFIYLIYFNAPRSRYILPAYPVLCITGTYFFYKLYLMNGKWKAFVNFNLFIFIGMVLINYPLLAAQHINRYKTLAGIQSVDEYLEERFYADGEFYKAVKWSNEHIDSSKKIYITHQQSFYFTREFLLGYSPNTTLSPINNDSVKSADDLIEKLKENGVSYIFYSEKYARRFCYNISELILRLENEKKISAIKKFRGNTIYKIESGKVNNNKF